MLREDAESLARARMKEQKRLMIDVTGELKKKLDSIMFLPECRDHRLSGKILLACYRQCFGFRPEIGKMRKYWGAANGGLGYLRKKALFPPFSGFSMCSSAPPEKGEKGRKRAKKGRFRPISGRGGQTPLKPHLLHPHLRQPKSIGFGLRGPRPENKRKRKIGKFGGQQKTNKHKQLRGIVAEMGGGQIVYVFPFFLGKRETHKQNSQEISEKGRDSPGIICVFLFIGFFSALKWRQNPIFEPVSLFSGCFLFFRGEAETRIFPLFSLIRAGGPKPIL